MTAIDHDNGVDVPEQPDRENNPGAERGTLEQQHRIAAGQANMFADAWHILRRIKETFTLPDFDNLAGGVDRTADLSPISYDGMMQWLDESLCKAATMAHSFSNQEGALAELRDRPRRLR